MPDLAGRSLVFVDTLCPAPYDLDSLARGAIGGTEATVLRIAAALAPRFPVRILQHNRTSPVDQAGITFAPLDLDRLAGDVSIGKVIILNAWKIVRRLRKRGLAAPISVWSHTYPGRHNDGLGRALTKADATLICVSQTQADTIARFLNERGAPIPRMQVLHNPVADDLAPDDTARDPDLLLFASSPHKGLDQTLACFREVRRSIPSLRLAVADPGYYPMPDQPPEPGVEQVGALAQPDLHRLMRRALCLFYPQQRFAETFGLVIAEANAVGTPALLHGPLGANAEVASSPDQILDGTDTAAVIRRLEAWRADRPRFDVRPEFRLARVTEDWVGFLKRGGGAHVFTQAADEEPPNACWRFCSQQHPPASPPTADPVRIPPDAPGTADLPNGFVPHAPLAGTRS